MLFHTIPGFIGFLSSPIALAATYCVLDRAALTKTELISQFGSTGLGFASG